jgi:predicted TPR repeat methyltransferase
VLVYLGDLAPTFEAASVALRPKGLFVFTVEAGTGDRFELNRTTKRYQHGKAYIERLAKMFGFKQRAIEETSVRTDAGQPVPGFLVALQFEVE